MLNNYTQYLQHILPYKSIKQPFTPNTEQLQMMEAFKDMVNHCIRVGLENNCSTMKKLSLVSYHTLKDYQIQSKYKFTAIAQLLADWHKEKRHQKRQESKITICQQAISCIVLWF
jgi:putative transposase